MQYINNHQYAVTDKADGLRRLLVTSVNGLVFLTDGSFNFKEAELKANSEFTDLISTVPGTILDGEYIPATHTIYLFDILFDKFQDVRSLPMLERHLLLSKLIQGNVLRNGSVYKLETKTFYYQLEKEKKVEPPRETAIVKYTDDIVAKAIEIRDRQDHPYTLDGIIFSPAREEYLKKTSKYDPKPLPHLKFKDFPSIDVRLKKSGNKYEFYGFDGTEETRIQNSLPTSIDIDDTLTKTEYPLNTESNTETSFIKDRDIVEFKWDQSKWVPLCIRRAKPKPNAVFVIDNIYKIIANPHNKLADIKKNYQKTQTRVSLEDYPIIFENVVRMDQGCYYYSNNSKDEGSYITVKTTDPQFCKLKPPLVGLVAYKNKEYVLTKIVGVKPTDKMKGNDIIVASLVEQGVLDDEVLPVPIEYALADEVLPVPIEYAVGGKTKVPVLKYNNFTKNIAYRTALSLINQEPRILDRNRFNIPDEEAKYSVTQEGVIKKMYAVLKGAIPDYKTWTKVIDATANVGVDSLHFAVNLPNAKVSAIELMPQYHEALKKNIKTFRVKNLEPVLGNVYSVLAEQTDKVDMIYFDPPWGGKDYFKIPKLMLQLVDTEDVSQPVYHIINRIFAKELAKVVLMKLPFNFDRKSFDTHLAQNLSANYHDIDPWSTHHIPNKKPLGLVIIRKKEEVSTYLASPNKYLIEYASGEGADLASWYQEGNGFTHVLAIDDNVGSMQEAVRRYQAGHTKRKWNRDKMKVTFVQGDFNKPLLECGSSYEENMKIQQFLDLANGKVDLISCQLAIHYVNDLKAFMTGNVLPYMKTDTGLFIYTYIDTLPIQKYLDDNKPVVYQYKDMAGKKNPFYKITKGAVGRLLINNINWDNMKSTKEEAMFSQQKLETSLSDITSVDTMQVNKKWYHQSPVPGCFVKNEVKKSVTKETPTQVVANSMAFMDLTNWGMVYSKNITTLMIEKTVSAVFSQSIQYYKDCIKEKEEEKTEYDEDNDEDNDEVKEDQPEEQKEQKEDQPEEQKEQKEEKTEEQKEEKTKARKKSTIKDVDKVRAKEEKLKLKEEKAKLKEEKAKLKEEKAKRKEEKEEEKEEEPKARKKSTKDVRAKEEKAKLKKPSVKKPVKEPELAPIQEIVEILKKAKGFKTLAATKDFVKEQHPAYSVADIDTAGDLWQFDKKVANLVKFFREKGISGSESTDDLEELIKNDQQFKRLAVKEIIEKAKEVILTALP